VTGATDRQLSATGYRLSPLTDPWVTSQRAAVLGQLHSLGFATSTASQVDLTAMAAIQLTDWPAIARLGAAG